MEEAKLAHERMLEAIDNLMRAAGSIVVAQPSRMTEAAAHLEEARSAMQASLRRDGMAVYNALCQVSAAPAPEPQDGAFMEWSPEVEDALVRSLTPQQQAVLIRLRDGQTLHRDHARGRAVGDRNIVYRWNDLDPTVSEAIVRKLTDLGLVAGYEEVSARRRRPSLAPKLG